MSHKRSSKNFQMDREPKQTGPKGCCCKRSQCIKNYCDCYQSMVICSIHCKCIGCRNTEERRSVDAPPIKTAVAAKRERAAALSAKAAAAAAKSGVNMHIRPTSSSATFVVPQGDAPPILQLPDMDVGNLVTMPPLTTIAQTRKPPIAVVLPMPKVKTPKDINVIKPAICVALLERVMLMASEAEEVDMNTVQVGKLVLKEFGRGLKDINECYTTTINPE